MVEVCQQLYADQVSSLINQGEKHLSVFVPMGSGRSGIISMILVKTKLKSVLISENESALEFCAQRITELTDTKPLAVTEEVFSSSTGPLSGLIIFLLDLKAPARQRVLERIRHESCITLSFSYSPCGIDYMSIDSSYYPIFCTKESVDIRDVTSSSIEDIDYARKRISKKRKEVFVHTICAPINASNELAEEEQLRLQRELDESNRKIEKYETLLKLYDQVFALFGVSPELLKKTHDVIESIKGKSQYSNMLGDYDHKEELMICALESEIASEIDSIMSGYIPAISKERYAEILSDTMGSHIWGRIMEESRSYLITGKTTYDMYTKSLSADSLDFSGICLEITKAFDMEMTERFYVKYIQYLNAKHIPATNLPDTIYDRGNGMFLPPAKFTLGTIQYVVGMNKNGYIFNKQSYDLFFDYARKVLYCDINDNQEINQSIHYCVVCAEKVRMDYRNPAAHRHSLNKTTAKACLDYIIDIQKTLKRILEKMSV